MAGAPRTFGDCGLETRNGSSTGGALPPSAFDRCRAFHPVPCRTVLDPLHDLTTARGKLGYRRRHVCARCGERCGLCRELIEYPHIVACIEQATSHSLSHAAEANEPYFHVFPEQAWCEEEGRL